MFPPRHFVSQFSVLIRRVDMTEVDHYTTLGVNRFATTADIRRAYRALALQLHPDKNPNAATHSRFQAITDAYSVLSDNTQKTMYDMKLFAKSTPTPKYSYGTAPPTGRARPQTAGQQRTSTGGWRPSSTYGQPKPEASQPQGDNEEKIERDRAEVKQGTRSSHISGYTLSEAELAQLRRMRERDESAMRTSHAEYDAFLNRTATPTFGTRPASSSGTRSNLRPSSSYTYSSFSSSSDAPKPTPSTSQQAPVPTPPSSPSNAPSPPKRQPSARAFSFVTEETVNSVLDAIRQQREEIEKSEALKANHIPSSSTPPAPEREPREEPVKPKKFSEGVRFAGIPTSHDTPPDSGIFTDSGDSGSEVTAPPPKSPPKSTRGYSRPASAAARITSGHTPDVAAASTPAPAAPRTSASTCAPTTLNAKHLEVPSDDIITEMNPEALKALVQALEHKAKVARQALLLQTLTR